MSTTEAAVVRNGLLNSSAGWVWPLGGAAVLAFAVRHVNRLWLRYTEKRDRSVEGARYAERKRIARELHDTLLQGLQGILLELEVLSSKLSEEDRARVALIERKLRHIVVDGRNAINELRSPYGEEKNWIDTILELGGRAASHSRVSFNVKIKGSPWILPPKVQTEALAIVREGLRNAFEHAHAKAIMVVVIYTKHGVKISVRDDGIGVSEDHFELRRKEGHWGIAGMHERAEKLRGSVTFRSTLFKGTTVSLVIPRNLSWMTPWILCAPWSRRGKRARCNPFPMSKR